MKKMLSLSGVGLMLMWSGLASASWANEAPDRGIKTSITQSKAPRAVTPAYGVSIGTVDAVDYDASNFPGLPEQTQLVVRLNADTYIGFVQTLENYYDENGNSIGNVMEQSVGVTGVISNEENVTIPDNIRYVNEYGETLIRPVRSVFQEDLVNYFSENIRTLTLPATLNWFRTSKDYPFGKNLDAIYMLGKNPSMEGLTFQYIMAPTVYICNRQDYLSYASKSFPYTNLKPYGWNFTSGTVKVTHPGDFTDVYLSENDFRWDALECLKVTGELNENDLKGMANIPLIVSLDLSEASFSNVPDEFMSNRWTLTEILLPASVKNIGKYAFQNCFQLSKLSIPSVSVIQEYAFLNCEKIKEVDLTGAEEIKGYAFYGCLSLSQLNLPSIKEIGDGRVFQDYSDKGYAFAHCENLREINLGSSLAEICPYSFIFTGIRSLTLPEGLTSIQKAAFARCEKLQDVSLPASVGSIGEQAFYGCAALTNVSIADYGLTEIRFNAFNHCTSLEEITLPATTQTICAGAFDYTNIKKFTCMAAIPPQIEKKYLGYDYATGESRFERDYFIGEGMDMDRTILYVPGFSKASYKSMDAWSPFFIKRSITETINDIFVYEPLDIMLEAEHEIALTSHPDIVLNIDKLLYASDDNFAQLTIEGDGTLNAGKLYVNSFYVPNSSRSGYWIPSGETTQAKRSENRPYVSTLINYDKNVSADEIISTLYFDNSDYKNHSNGKWFFLSFPYDVKVSDILWDKQTYWVIRRYDAAARAEGKLEGTWVDLNEDDMLEAGKGYIVSTTSDIVTDAYNNPYMDFTILQFHSADTPNKNNIFRTSDVSITLEDLPADIPHDQSWNFIGNPYPCFYDMTGINDDFTSPITVWNGSRYVAYSPIDDQIILAPNEAFFVQSPGESTILTFGEQGRMHYKEGSNALMKKPRESSTVELNGRNVFDFEVSSEDFSDRTRIVLNPQAEITYEPGRDAAKFLSEEAGIELYVVGDTNYSITERPLEDGRAVLSFKGIPNCCYTLSLSGKFNEGWGVRLTDTVSGATVDLTDSNYQFVCSSDEAEKRFIIDFMISGDETTYVDSIHDLFDANTVVTVTSIDGKIIYTGPFNDLSVPATSVYIITDGHNTYKSVLK